MIDHNHPFVGRTVVYRDPYGKGPEQGVITSVNVETNTVFVRYGLGCTSAGTTCDERLTFLNGDRLFLADGDERDREAIAEGDYGYYRDPGVSDR